MGQRSQIYVRYNKGDKKGLVANYYQWNYGERMISRARWGIEWILGNIEYGNWFFQNNTTKISRIFDINFDMKDIQLSCDIIAEHKNVFPEENFNEYVFKMQDNNDGKLFVDIDIDNDNKIVKYAFLGSDANTDDIMDAETYMNWNSGKDWKKTQYIHAEGITTCEENIEYISENAKLMTKEEIEEFINYEYIQQTF